MAQSRRRAYGQKRTLPTDDPPGAVEKDRERTLVALLYLQNYAAQADLVANFRLL